MTKNAVNVTMVGLAVEHATEDQTVWEGEDGKRESPRERGGTSRLLPIRPVRDLTPLILPLSSPIAIPGKVYFYQCELPYDADETFAADGRAGYRIGPGVTSHEASGLGIYSNFRDHDVRVPTAVVHPEVPPGGGEGGGGRGGIELRNVFTVKLDNMGGIESVVNGRGPGATDETPRGVPLRCGDGGCGE